MHKSLYMSPIFSICSTILYKGELFSEIGFLFRILLQKSEYLFMLWSLNVIFFSSSKSCFFIESKESFATDNKNKKFLLKTFSNSWYSGFEISFIIIRFLNCSIISNPKQVFLKTSYIVSNCFGLLKTSRILK